MSVIVKGMEMPNKCCECNIRYEMFCPLLHRFIADEGRRHNCPLGEVPEQHGRLGDLDRLEQIFADIDNAPYSGFDGTEPFYSAEDAAQIIRLAPTIIPKSGEGE